MIGRVALFEQIDGRRLGEETETRRPRTRLRQLCCLTPRPAWVPTVFTTLVSNSY